MATIYITKIITLARLTCPAWSAIPPGPPRPAELRQNRPHDMALGRQDVDGTLAIGDIDHGKNRQVENAAA